VADEHSRHACAGSAKVFSEHNRNRVDPKLQEDNLLSLIAMLLLSRPLQTLSETPTSEQPLETNTSGSKVQPATSLRPQRKLVAWFVIPPEGVISPSILGHC